jgi:hypothetical protein
MICTFEDFDIAVDATDAAIWQVCQDHNILLITGNRNAESPESLEMAIRQRHASNCLPVLTLADPDRIARDRHYAESIVERLFDILIDPDALRDQVLKAVSAIPSHTAACPPRSDASTSMI